MKNDWFLIASTQELKGKKQPLNLRRLGHDIEVSWQPRVEIRWQGKVWPHVVEDGDSIWMNFSDEPNEFRAYWPAPPPEEKFSYCELRSVVHTSVEPILENFIDCTHTSYVHAGILRGEPVQEVTATVQSTERGIMISTLGEKISTATITKMFNPKNESVYHTDELILPHTVRVEYRFGPKKRVIASSICAPIDDGTTKIYTRIYLKWPVFQSLVLAYLKYSTRVILNQDKVILDDQARNFKRYGTDFRLFVAADAGALAIRRAWSDHVNGRGMRAMRPVKIALKV